MGNQAVLTATYSDIPGIDSFMQECDTLDPKGYTLSTNRREDLEEKLNFDSVLFTAIDEQTQAIIAYACLELGDNSELPIRIKYYLQDLLQENDIIGWFSGMLVHPRHRGHGLQTTLLKSREEYAKANGATFLIAVVNPENKHSIDNLIGNNFSLVLMRDLYIAFKRPKGGNQHVTNISTIQKG